MAVLFPTSFSAYFEDVFSPRENGGEKTANQLSRTPSKYKGGTPEKTGAAMSTGAEIL